MTVKISPWSAFASAAKAQARRAPTASPCASCCRALSSLGTASKAANVAQKGSAVQPARQRLPRRSVTVQNQPCRYASNSPPSASWTRTHTCGELSTSNSDQSVTLSGWLLPLRRLSKTFGFFRLQDAHGATQVVVRGDKGSAEASQLLDELESLPLQSVLAVRGTVKARPPDAVTGSSATDSIELLLSEFRVLNLAARDLPFQPHDTANLANEELRARYRYLDLRRPALARNVQLRSTVAHVVRQCLHADGFSEVETPVLLRSTPEGAAEFLVPTRLSKMSGNASSNGSSASEPLFYALPQSPQQPKQLLVVSGCVDRYYQFARCFRDEDSRKDRQVEFTQIDMELAFVSEEAQSSAPDWRMGGIEVRNAVEGMLAQVWKQALGKDLFASGLPRSTDAISTQAHTRLPVITYEHAMSTYGSDKPDRRFGLHIHRLDAGLRPHSGSTEADNDSEPVSSAVDVLVCPAAGEALSNKSVDELLKGLGGAAGSSTPIERFKARTSSPHELAGLLLKKSRHVSAQLQAQELAASQVDVEHLAAHLAAALEAARAEPWAQGGSDDACFVFVAPRANPPVGGSTALGDLRLRLASRLESHGVSTRSASLQGVDDMFWVTEFPLFSREYDDATGAPLGWSSTHHPFTAPMKEDMPLLLSAAAAERALDDDAISRIRGQHYDLVLNGTEVGGGSVRVHQADVQELIMRRVLGLNDEETGRFGHLLRALRCGAPPHGGIALGFDRLMAIICKVPSIRDVIAFPKTSSGADPVFGSPSPAPAPHVDAKTGTSGRPVLEQYGLRPL